MSALHPKADIDDRVSTREHRRRRRFAHLVSDGLPLNRPLAGHVEPGKAACRIRPTINANLTVTPPVFGPGDSANRSASARAYFPPKYPGCRSVTQDFAQSVSGQHGQQYLSRRAVVIGKPTKELKAWA